MSKKTTMDYTPALKETYGGKDVPAKSKRQWKFMKALEAQGGKNSKMAKEYTKDQPTPKGLPDKKKK